MENLDTLNNNDINYHISIIKNNNLHNAKERVLP